MELQSVLDKAKDLSIGQDSFKADDGKEVTYNRLVVTVVDQNGEEIDVKFVPDRSEGRHAYNIIRSAQNA